MQQREREREMFASFDVRLFVYVWRAVAAAAVATMGGLVPSPPMVVAAVCLLTTFGSTILRRNCVDVLMYNSGIHITHVLAKHEHMKTTVGGVR